MIPICMFCCYTCLAHAMYVYTCDVMYVHLQLQYEESKQE